MEFTVSRVLVSAYAGNSSEWGSLSPVVLEILAFPVFFSLLFVAFLFLLSQPVGVGWLCFTVVPGALGLFLGLLPYFGQADFDVIFLVSLIGVAGLMWFFLMSLAMPKVAAGQAQNGYCGFIRFGSEGKRWVLFLFVGIVSGLPPLLQGASLVAQTLLSLVDFCLVIVVIFWLYRSARRRYIAVPSARLRLVWLFAAAFMGFVLAVGVVVLSGGPRNYPVFVLLSLGYLMLFLLMGFYPWLTRNFPQIAAGRVDFAETLNSQGAEDGPFAQACRH